MQASVSISYPSSFGSGKDTKLSVYGMGSYRLVPYFLHHTDYDNDEVQYSIFCRLTQQIQVERLVGMDIYVYLSLFNGWQIYSVNGVFGEYWKVRKHDKDCV